MDSDLKDLLAIAGLTIATLAAQWSMTPEKAAEAAGKTIRSTYGYVEAKRKMRKAVEDGEKRMQIGQYTITW